MSVLDNSRTGARKPAAASTHTAATRGAISADVAADLDAWKKAMQEERRVRLQSSQSLRRQPAQPQDRKSEPRVHENMSMQQFRKHLHEVSGRQRENVTNRNRSLSRSGSPRHAAVSGLDPLDVYYKPAVSTVKQRYMKEPIPFFVRRNKFGTLDGYADQAAATIYRQRERSESGRIDPAPTAAATSLWNRSTEAIRPIRAASPVWRQESPRLQEFPTPRSTMLRQNYIAARHRREVSQERSAPRQRSRVVVSHTPVASSVHARLVGPPWASPAWSRPQLVADSVLGPPELREKPSQFHIEVVSPHQRGDRDLPRRKRVDGASAHSCVDKKKNDDDDDFIDGDADFDPVPLPGNAPSPHHRSQGVDEMRSRRPGSYPSASPEHRLSSPAGRAPVAWSPPHDGPVGFEVRHSFPVWGASETRLAHHRSNGADRPNHASPPVDVSPPTPAGVPQQRVPTASPQRDAPDPQRKPIQNLLTQLALPTMRHSRPDLFQGHPNRPGSSAMSGDNEGERLERPGNLRHSPLHDRLEQQLTQRLRSPAAHVDPSSPTGGKDLSMSRALLHQLATKRLQ